MVQPTAYILSPADVLPFSTKPKRVLPFLWKIPSSFWTNIYLFLRQENSIKVLFKKKYLKVEKVVCI